MGRKIKHRGGRTLAAILIVVMMVSLLPTTAMAAEAKPFVPKPGYATDFIAKCDGQAWFINEVEKILNANKKTLDNIDSIADLDIVKSLGFKDMGIDGKIPAAIGELRELRYLFLSGNNLSGAIPASLFALSKLQNIDLAGNNYAGDIPMGFGTMPSLTHLNLRSNAWTDTIPVDILGNKKIEFLDVSSNKLSGAMPEFAAMTALKYLAVSDNDWSEGAIPNLAPLTKLVSLSMWNCNRAGEIPGFIYTLTDLQILDLAENALTGEFSSAVTSLTKLQLLILGNNKLEGVVPAGIGLLPDMTVLDISHNRLRGHLPADILNIPTVYAENNYLTGSVAASLTNNEKNFVDGETSEQYQLISTQSKVRIYEDKTTNVYPLLRNKSYKTGSATDKPVLRPDEYELVYDSMKIEVTIDAAGIHVKALVELTGSDLAELEIRIKDNTGSDYSTVKLILTTDAVSSGGGGSSDTVIDEDDPPLSDWHNPYINGFPGGTFKPEDDVTREQIAKMVVAALGIDENTAHAVSYTDVASNRWSYAYIESATECGYLNGFGNGIFGPERAMTRAELATCLVRIAEKMGRVAEGDARVFSDVTGDEWYAEYVAKAAKLGLVNGYEDGSFRPDKSVTRAEAVTMINRMLGRDPNTAAELRTVACPFGDIKSEHWAYLQVLEASLGHEH